MYLGVYAEIHSTNEDVLELVDHWAVTDKTSYHHFLVMSCWQHAIACFFFFIFRTRIPSFRPRSGLLCPGLSLLPVTYFPKRFPLKVTERTRCKLIRLAGGVGVGALEQNETAQGERCTGLSGFGRGGFRRRRVRAALTVRQAGSSFSVPIQRLSAVSEKILLPLPPTFEKPLTLGFMKWRFRKTVWWRIMQR